MSACACELHLRPGGEIVQDIRATGDEGLAKSARIRTVKQRV
jgi:hypothetical protein